MKKNIYQVVLSLTFMVACSIPSAFSQQPPYLTKIEAIIDSIAEAEDLPALSVGIIFHEEEPIYINRGYFDRSEKKEVNEHSRYQIASLSKMFAGIVAHQLVIDGKISLSQPITDFFPVSLSDKTKKKFEGVTFQKLLHHRADLPRNARVGYKRRDGDPYLYKYTEEDMLQELTQLKRKGKGEFRYSNFGYSLLGYLLEQVTGQPYEVLLQTYVFAPFGMQETTYTLPTGNPELVTPYRKDDREVKTEGWYMGKLSPATTICSSSHDLLKLMKAQIHAYRQLGKGENVSKLVLTEHTEEAWTGIGEYGFGLFKWTSGDFGHGGDVDGFASDYSFHPVENFGVTILTSSGGKWVSNLIISTNDILREAHAQ